MSMFRRSRPTTTARVAESLGAYAPTAAARTVSLTKGSGPATERTAVEAGGVDLAKKFDKVGISLSKRGLEGIRAEVSVYLDYSGSMGNDYRNGTVQALVDRTLAFGLQVDGDGSIPVIRFGSQLFDPVEVTVANHASVMPELTSGSMGYTNLAVALEHLLAQARETDTILYAAIITDGDPYLPGDGGQVARCTRLVKELAAYPVFLKFLSIQPVDYLDELDDIPAGQRLVDNCDAKDVPDPAQIPDLVFADIMTDEWQSWITAARAAGIVR